MLKVDLAELLRLTGKYIDVDIDDMPKSDEDVIYVAPAKGHVTITNSGGLVLVRGWVETAVELECGRCLTDVREPIEAEIEEQYTLADINDPRHHSTEVAVVADEENEVPTGLMNGAVMDLEVLIRQAVILNLPLRPLCKESCLGLCAVCGKNRNDPNSGCECVQVVRHTPLAVLKQFDFSDAGGDNEESAGQIQRNGNSGA